MLSKSLLLASVSAAKCPFGFDSSSPKATRPIVQGTINASIQYPNQYFICSASTPPVTTPSGFTTNQYKAVANAAI